MEFITDGWKSDWIQQRSINSPGSLIDARNVCKVYGVD